MHAYACFGKFSILHIVYCIIISAKGGLVMTFCQRTSIYKLALLLLKSHDTELIGNYCENQVDKENEKFTKRKFK